MVTVIGWVGSTFAAPFAGTVVKPTGGNVGDGEAEAAALVPVEPFGAPPPAMGSCLEPEFPELATAAAMPPMAPTVTSPPAMMRLRRGIRARSSDAPPEAAGGSPSDSFG